MNEKYNNFPWCLERGTSRIFESEDKTEILRWFAQEDVPRQQKEDFISALIDFEDGCGGFYRYRAYFLAAEALAYFPDCYRGDEIVRQLLRWSYAYFQEKPNWEKIPISLVRAAQTTLEKTDRKRVVAAFVEKVHTTESKFVLRHAAERLGKLDPGNKSAIAALVLLMQRSPEPYTIWKAACSLMAIDPKHPEIAPTLISLIEKLPTYSRRLWKIGEAIINIDPNYPTLIPTLVALTQKHPSNYRLLLFAVRVLGKVGEGNEAAIDTLIRLTEITQEQLLDNDFYSDSSEWLRKLAAESLGKIAVGDEKAIAALLKLIATARKPCSPLIYDCTRSYWKAVDALGKIAVGNENAIAVLTEIVQTHSDVMIRCAAAASLSKIDAGNTMAIAVLSQTLETLPEDLSERSQTTLENRSLLWLIADCLIETDDYREDAIAVLQDTLLKFYSCPDPSACLSSLARIDSTYELAIETVFQLLRRAIVCSALFVSTISPYCIYCLGSYLKDTPKMYLQDNAIAELTKFIQKSWNCENLSNFDYLFSVAAITLQKIDPGNPIVVSTLIRLIEARDPIDLLKHSTKHISIRSYCNLTEVDASDRILIDKIIECFQTILPEDNRPFHYLVYREPSLLNLAEMLAQSQLEISKSSLAKLARSLKPFYRNPPNRYHCYDASYQMIWHCAQRMSYSAFYCVWQE